MSASFAIRVRHEVYVYVRGRLVMKLWDSGACALFQVAPAQTVWMPRIATGGGVG